MNKVTLLFSTASLLFFAACTDYQAEFDDAFAAKEYADDSSNSNIESSGDQIPGSSDVQNPESSGGNEPGISSGKTSSAVGSSSSAKSSSSDNGKSSSSGVNGKSSSSEKGLSSSSTGKSSSSVGEESSSSAKWSSSSITFQRIGDLYWTTQNVLAEQEGSKCFLLNNAGNEWNCYYTLKAAKNVCPGESRLPSNADWSYLIECAGGDSVASKALKSKKWDGKDTYGFNVLPLGAYDGSTDRLAGLLQEAFFWSSESLYVSFKTPAIETAPDKIKMARDDIGQGEMFSVRCVQGSRMCGTISYDHDSSYCSNEMVIEALQTCGAALYNPEKSFCYEYKKEIYPLCYDSTGKLASYNVTSYFCNEENKIVAYEFCGVYKKAYNPEKEYCDSNSTVQKLKDCGSGDSKKKYNPETHICDSHDGQVYKYVTIGGNSVYRRTWMAENLNRETSNSYCYGDNKENCEKYGRLYTWAAATDAGLCPDGWRLPLKEDFELLFDFVDDSTTVGEKLRSTSGWNGGQGTDDYGFNALPSGSKFSGNYNYGAGTANPQTAFWTSSELSSERAYSMSLKGGDKKAALNKDPQTDALSVRCVKGSLPKCGQLEYDPTKKFCDTRDLHAYKYVTIGSQVWMAENLNYRMTEAEGQFCYSGAGSNCGEYGGLYVWETAKAACPAGWHLPTSTEFETLINSAGGTTEGAIRLKATKGWDNNDGTDDFGFAALGAGFRDQADGTYKQNGIYAYFWSSSPLLDYVDGCATGACAHFMLLRVQEVQGSDISVTAGAKTAGMSVRCMRD